MEEVGTICGKMSNQKRIDLRRAVAPVRIDRQNRTTYFFPSLTTPPYQTPNMSLFRVKPITESYRTDFSRSTSASSFGCSRRLDGFLGALDFVTSGHIFTPLVNLPGMITKKNSFAEPKAVFAELFPGQRYQFTSLLNVVSGPYQIVEAGHGDLKALFLKRPMTKYEKSMWFFEEMVHALIAPNSTTVTLQELFELFINAWPHKDRGISLFKNSMWKWHKDCCEIVGSGQKYRIGVKPSAGQRDHQERTARSERPPRDSSVGHSREPSFDASESSYYRERDFSREDRYRDVGPPFDFAFDSQDRMVRWRPTPPESLHGSARSFSYDQRDYHREGSYNGFDQLFGIENLESMNRWEPVQEYFNLGRKRPFDYYEEPYFEQRNYYPEYDYVEDQRYHEEPRLSKRVKPYEHGFDSYHLNDGYDYQPSPFHPQNEEIRQYSPFPESYSSRLEYQETRLSSKRNSPLPKISPVTTVPPPSTNTTIPSSTTFQNTYKPLTYLYEKRPTAASFFSPLSDDEDALPDGAGEETAVEVTQLQTEPEYEPGEAVPEQKSTHDGNYWRWTESDDEEAVEKLHALPDYSSDATEELQIYD